MINIHYLINAARTASKPLFRDHTELGKLQTSPKGIGNFVQRAISRTKEILDQEIPPKIEIIWVQNENTEDVSEWSNYNESNNDEINANTLNNENNKGDQNQVTDRPILFIKPLDGIVDFARSMQSFAFFIHYRKGGHYATVIALPALNYILFCEKGQGLFIEDNFGVKRKLRIHTPVLVNPRIISTHVSVDYENAKNILNYMSKSHNHGFYSKIYQTSFRYSDSKLYALCSLVMSKSDILISNAKGLMQEVEQSIMIEGAGIAKNVNGFNVYGHDSIF